MRRHLILALAIGAGLNSLRGMAATDDTIGWRNSGLIARFHFAGTERITTDPTATNLAAIAALPETAALREQTFQKLSVAPYDYFRKRASITSDEAALIRPMLNDLFRFESFGEMAADTNAFPESVIALRLSDDRARLWSKNLSTVLGHWSGLPVTAIQADGFTGWELKKHEDPNLFCFFRAGDWVVIGWGEDTLRLAPAVLGNIRQSGRPVAQDNANWLDAWADWPALAPHVLPPGFIKLPAMRLLVQGRKGFVRSELTMKFAAPLGWKLNPWRIPTNIIGNPIVSFTATRGLFPLLDNTQTARSHNLPPLPDQVYVWAMANIPLQTYAVAQVKDAPAYLDRLEPGLLAMVNPFLSRHSLNVAGANNTKSVSFEAFYTNKEIQITQMPFIAPRLGTYRDQFGEYLFGGFIPRIKAKQPLPPELSSEIMTHPNLVAYGWEYTGERIKQWYGLFGLGQAIFNFGALDPKGAAHRWIQGAVSKLANTGTEVSLTAPDEVTVLRNSSVGFTSVELCAWAYWLDAPDFPLGTYGNTPRAPRVPRGPPPPH